MAKNVGRSSFGHLSRDRNQIPIQTANSFVVQDATAVPQVSPLAYSGTGIYNLVVPDGAIELVFTATTDVRVGPGSGLVSYFLVKANVITTLGVASMQNVYVQRDASDGSLNFRFNVV